VKFTIERDVLLKPLQLLASVIERKQTLPVLANALLVLRKQELALVGTDLEIELQARITPTQIKEMGTITTQAHKLTDICRNLPEGATLEFLIEGSRLVIRSGRSRFSLGTLPANSFPVSDETVGKFEFMIPQNELRKLIENTSFAMAQQDVRYYLNGMLWEIGKKYLRTVATDGHRMALSEIETKTTEALQFIVPRKSIFELSRLLLDTTGEVIINVDSNWLRIRADQYVFTSKLIDGQFPAYDKVVPKGGDNILVINRDVLKQALIRVTTLAKDKHHAVRVELQPGSLRFSTNNSEQEEAEEEISIDYQGQKIDMGFNANYLLEVISSLPDGDIKLTLSDPDSSVRIEGINDKNSVYVVMPMRL
jgi:DNA polymerase-3 subunit beta